MKKKTENNEWPPSITAMSPAEVRAFMESSAAKGQARRDMERGGPSLWVLEFRTRARRNGKWSEWESMEHKDRPVVAYREYPSDRILNADTYERRAVEYVRKA